MGVSSPVAIMPVWCGVGGFPQVAVVSVHVVMTRLPCPSSETASVRLHPSSNFPNWFASRRWPHLLVSSCPVGSSNSSDQTSVYPGCTAAPAGRTFGLGHRMQNCTRDDRARTRIQSVLMFVLLETGV